MTYRIWLETILYNYEHAELFLLVLIINQSISITKKVYKYATVLYLEDILVFLCI